MATIVLLHAALIAATPCGMLFRSFFFVPARRAPAFGARAVAIVFPRGVGSRSGVWKTDRISHTPLPTPHNQFLFLRCLLLACDGALAGTFAGTGVRMCPLAAHGETAAMAHAAITVDFHEALDVQADVLAEIALDFALIRNHLPDLADVILGQILDARVRADGRFRQNVFRARPADAVDIRQADFDPLVQWKVHTCNTCHWLKLLVIPDAAYVSGSRR